MFKIHTFGALEHVTSKEPILGQSILDLPLYERPAVGMVDVLQELLAQKYTLSILICIPEVLEHVSYDV